MPASLLTLAAGSELLKNLVVAAAKSDRIINHPPLNEIGAPNIKCIQLSADPVI